MGTSVIALSAVALIPVGDDSALKWLVDLCLPDGAPAPDVAPIAMEHKSHFAAKGAGILALASAALVYFGLTHKTADPDKLLAAMAYMANATPGITEDDLAKAISEETGFALSKEDARDAMLAYRGEMRPDDLEWISSDTTPSIASKTLSAALHIGWSEKGFTRDALKTLAALAKACDVSGEELARLLPKPSEAPDYDLFPAFDSVSHWIGRAFDTLTLKLHPKTSGDFRL